MTSSLGEGPGCLRAGWIFHQKSTFGKTWQRKWVSIGTDGTLTVGNKKKSKIRSSHTYDLRRDCMYTWRAAQCQHLLPPPDQDSSQLIELLFTGDRRLAFCALSADESELWNKCIEDARAEKGVPAPRHPTAGTGTLEGVPEESDVGCCVCSRPSSKVTAFDYRPSTKQSASSSNRKKRRVSWSNEVTVIIDE